jgi:hypothetical protein
MTRPLCFVDDAGGAFAALAAAFAGAAGLHAGAATTAEVGVEAEIEAVLDEVGLDCPDVIPARKATADAERVDVSGWGHPLHHGEGELERLALARIARDRIERRVEALLSASSRAADRPG